MKSSPVQEWEDEGGRIAPAASSNTNANTNRSMTMEEKYSGTERRQAQHEYEGEDRRKSNIEMPFEEDNPAVEAGQGQQEGDKPSA